MSKEKDLTDVFQEELLDACEISEDWYKSLNLKTADLTHGKFQEYKLLHSNARKAEDDQQFDIRLIKLSPEINLEDEKNYTCATKLGNAIQNQDAASGSLSTLGEEPSISTLEQPKLDTNKINYNINNESDENIIFFSPSKCLKRNENISQNHESPFSSPVLNVNTSKTNFNLEGNSQTQQEPSESPFLEKILDILCSPVQKIKSCPQKRGQLKLQNGKSKCKEVKIKKVPCNAVMEEYMETELIPILDQIHKKLNEAAIEDNAAENLQENISENNVADISLNMLDAICDASEIAISCVETESNLNCKSTDKLYLKQNEQLENNIMKQNNLNTTKFGLNKNLIYSLKDENKSKSNKKCEINVCDILQSAQILESAEKRKHLVRKVKTRDCSETDGFQSFNSLNSKFTNKTKAELNLKKSQNEIFQNIFETESDTKIPSETEGDTTLKDVNYISDTQILQVEDAMDIYNMFDESFNSCSDKEINFRQVNSIGQLHDMSDTGSNFIEAECKHLQSIEEEAKQIGCTHKFQTCYEKLLGEPTQGYDNMLSIMTSQVSTSEQALAETEKALNDSQNVKLTSKIEFNHKNLLNISEKGLEEKNIKEKPMEISNEVKKSKESFNDFVDNKQLFKFDGKTIKNYEHLQYQSSSEKQVLYTEKKIIKPKLISNDFLVEERFSVSESLENEIAICKKLQISEEALMKAKEIVNDGLDKSGFYFDEKGLSCTNYPLELQTACNQDRISDSKSKSISKHFYDPLEGITFSVDKKLLSNSKNPQGFQKSSNKINISEQALIKVKETFNDDLFEDIFPDSTLTNKKLLSSSNTSLELETSGKKVSSKGLMQSKEIIEDYLHDEIFSDSKTESDDLLSNQKSCLGFQKASGENVNILETALKEAKESFNNCLLDEMFPDSIFNNEKVLSSTKIPPECKIVSGEKVGISEEALMKGKEIVNKMFFVPKVSKDKLLSAPKSFLGFQTASGKNIEISEEAVMKAKSTFNDCLDDEIVSDSKHSNEKVLSCSEKDLQFQSTGSKNINISKKSLMKSKETINLFNDSIPKYLFTNEEKLLSSKMPLERKAGSGKKVKISEKDLLNVETNFNNCFDEKIILDSKINNDKLLNCPKTLLGFQTASGKIVKISEESIMKAKTTFSDCFNETMVSDSKVDNDKFLKNSKTHLGFQTASGKKVSISEEALMKARTTFNDGFDEKIVSDSIVGNDKLLNTPTPRLGFQTASGKKVSISEEALMKAKTTLNDCLDETIDSDSIIGNDKLLNTPTPQLGFQTASGKKVKISEESLMKARTTFNDGFDEKIVSDSIIGNDKLLNTPTPRLGFQTASGKKVSISEEALMKAKTTLNDCLDETIDSDSIIGNDKFLNSPTPRLGFQTASGKKVKISEESLMKARTTFNDGFDEKIVSDSIIFNDKLLNTPTPRLGFQTASGKKVSISEEALMKARTTFNNDFDEKIVSNSIIGNDNLINSPTRLGFQTASGKKVSISEEALMKAKTTLNDYLDETIDSDSIIGNDKFLNSPTSRLGFQTASGKTVRISEEGLMKAETTLNDCLDETIDSDSLIGNDKFLNSPTPRLGFQTASGKKVKISEESLMKARTTFNDGFDEKIVSDSIIGNDKLLNTPTPRLGFQTASGKKVSISEEALMKARTTFNNGFDEKIVSNSIIGNDNLINSPTRLGFQTASGKKVSISEEALMKARTTLNGFDENIVSNSIIGNDKLINSPTSRLGFQTASGKKVRISEEALMKAKTTLNDCLDETIVSDAKIHSDKVLNSPTPLLGFQTASGKKVSISEEALMKAKTTFNDGFDEKIVSDSIIGNDKLLNSPTPRLGFQTASGKKVKISEEALIKAKTTFNDCLDETIGSDAKIRKNKVLNSPKTHLGFQTASGIKVKFSEEALMKAKSTFNDCLDDVIVFDTEIGCDKLLNSPKTHLGFQTAVGKKVKISEEALMKARTTFYDCFDEKMISDSLIGNDKLLNSPKTQPGFQTASGKKVKTSEEVLRKGKRTFSDCLDDKIISDAKTMDEEFSSNLKTSLELKAENGETISKKDLMEAKQTDNNYFLDEKSNVYNSNCSGNEQLLSNLKKLPGFQKASDKRHKISGVNSEIISKTNDQIFSSNLTLLGIQDKRMNISEEGLVKSTQSFNSCLDNQLFYDSKSRHEELINSSIMPLEPETPKKESIKISEEALNGCVNIEVLSDYKNSNKFSSSSKKQLENHKGCEGNIQISEEALVEVNQTFKECLADEKSSDSKSIEKLLSNSKTIPKFQTARGKHVTISKEALLKAKETLSDCYKVEVFSHSTCLNTSKEHVEFQTNSGKNVQISDEALIKAKETFHDCLGEEMFSDFIPSGEKLLSSPEKFLGIHTASKKKENVLEETSVQSQDTFNDCLDSKGVQNISKVTEKYFMKDKDIDNRTDEAEEFCSKFGSTREKSIMFCDKISKHKLDCITDSMKNNFPFSAFQTKTEKKVEVLKELIVKSKETFPALDDNVVSIDKQISENIPSGPIFKDHNISYDVSTDEKEESESEVPQSNPEQFFNKSLGNIGSISLSDDKLAQHGRLNSNDEGIYDAQCLKTDNLETGMKYQNEKSKKYLQNSNLQNDSNLSFSDEKISFLSNERSLCDGLANKKNNVISNSDLDILCCSLTGKQSSLENSTQWDNTDVFSLSVVHEVSESTAALLADEASLTTTEQPSWLKTYTCNPSIISDKQNRLQSFSCFGNEVTENIDFELSPVLGCKDRFHKKTNLHISKDLNTENERPVGKEPLNCNKTPVSKFKPPYSTSTPLSTTKKKESFKRRLDNLNHSTPFTKKLKIDNINNEKCLIGSDVITGRKKAAEEQEWQILNSKNLKLCKPCKGSYLLRKLNEKSTSLRDFTKKQRPTKFSYDELLQMGLKDSVIKVSSKNAKDFVFSAKDFYSKETFLTNTIGIPVGDGGLLVLNDKGEAGLTEITRCFLSSPGVDPTLASIAWVHNHFRWIVHKLASTERSFPLEFSKRLLTPNNVLLQLKYRYDREIERCQRPALRKILERDDSAGKNIVLFVSSIIDVKDQAADVKIELELSDGWYRIISKVDEEMAALVKSKVVVVGTKLLINGAELLNCEHGCDPLEMGDDVRLKISTNSVRRARWDTRLGFCTKQKPLICRVSTVLGKGGNIGYMSGLVVRVYPMLYLQKQDDGKSVLLNWKSEEKASKIHKQKRAARAETLYSQMQKEIQHERRPRRNLTRSLLKRDIASVCSPSELYMLLENAPDPVTIQDMMTKEQLEAVTEYIRDENNRKLHEVKTRVETQLEEEIPERVVIPLLKIRLVEPKSRSSKSCILTIWRPPGDTEALFNEGSTLGFHNIIAAGFRNDELQLTAGRQTCYEQLEKKSDLYARHVTRLNCASFADSQRFNEIDVIGMVIQVTKTTTYITDAQSNLFEIHFWPGIQELGWDDLFVPGAVIAGSNIQVRHGIVSWNIPCGYSTDCSTFSLHPRQPHLSSAISDLRNDIELKGLQNIMKESKEKLRYLMEHKNSGGVTPIPLDKSHDTVNSYVKNVSVNHDKISTTPTSCKRSRTELDISVNTPTKLKEALSPVEKKIKKLQNYGQVPSLSPVVLFSNSKTRKPFHAPLKRPVTPDSQPLSLDSDSES